MTQTTPVVISINEHRPLFLEPMHRAYTATPDLILQIFARSLICVIAAVVPFFTDQWAFMSALFFTVIAMVFVISKTRTDGFYNMFLPFADRLLAFLLIFGPLAIIGVVAVVIMYSEDILPRIMVSVVFSINFFFLAVSGLFNASFLRIQQ